jgi:hypothetical protein
MYACISRSWLVTLVAAFIRRLTGSRHVLLLACCHLLDSTGIVHASPLQALDAHLTATATGNTGAFSSTRDLVLELLAAGADPLSPVGLGTEEAQTASKRRAQAAIKQVELQEKASVQQLVSVYLASLLCWKVLLPCPAVLCCCI